jgi:hypothetical protein
MMSGKRWLCRALLAVVSAGSLAVAQNNTAPNTDTRQDLAALKAQIAAQQQQLDALRRTLEEQQRRLDTTPPPPPQTAPQAGSGSNPCEAPPDAKVPAWIRLGDTCVVPVGFMDLTAVWRAKTIGSSIGTNFAGTPYNNTLAGHLSEFRFSPQNSRLGFRADGNWKGAHFTAYNEFDFNGTSGGNNLSVTSGSFVPRIRLFWVDVRKGAVEFLAGQSWSMMTPNRTGISAMPGDLFYSQVIDLNYLTGLPWTRQPGVRLLLHPGKTVTIGIAAENPEQYMGGSSGGGSITLPAALAAYSGGELSNNTNVQAVPNFAPDFIAKVAFDPNSRIHFEVAGLQRTFRSYNPNTNARYKVIGGGVSANAMIGLTDNFRLTSTNFWSDGGGRYLFGQAPDVIVRADGSLSPIHAGGFTEGFEATHRNTLIYGYWGGTYIGRNTAVDANGTTPIGYGYRGSSNAQNRMIQEITFGFNQTMWKNARYGAVNFMGQYMWQTRSPWHYAGGPGGKLAQNNTLYFNLRYTLPGSMPSFE